MFKTIGDFLLGQWLWSITWDWYHIPINIILLALLFKVILRFNIISAVFISFLVNIYSFCVYSLFSFVVLYYLFDSTFSPAQTNFMVTQPMWACVYLGLIYTTIQATAFGILRIWYKTNYWTLVAVALVSNLLTAWFVSSMMPKTLL